MQDYKKIKVWEKAHRFVLSIYRRTANFPKEELYGLVQQMRRAAYSIPSNIAEGTSRTTDRDFACFLTMSMGSAKELEYFLLLTKDLGYIQQHDYIELNEGIEEIKKMLAPFIKRLKLLAAR